MLRHLPNSTRFGIWSKRATSERGDFSTANPPRSEPSRRKVAPPMSSQEVPQPHDSLVRLTFEQIGHAASFLQENLPEPLASAIAWEHLQLLRGSFVDQRLAQSHCDLLYKAPFRNEPPEKPLLLYLLFEHQSTPDPWMPLRLLGYKKDIWARHAAEFPKSGGVPPIHALVLAQVEGGWSVARQFHDLVLWPEDRRTRELLEGQQPKLDYALLDLAATQLEALRGGAIPRVAQVLLKGMLKGVEAAWFDWAIALLDEAGKAIPSLDALDPYFIYLLKVANLTAEEIQAKLSEARQHPQIASKIMSTYDQLIHKGLEKGRQEGRKEGELAGQVQAFQRMLGRAEDPSSSLAALSSAELAAKIAALEREVAARLK